MKFLIVVFAILFSVTAVRAHAPKLPEHLPVPVLVFNNDTMIIKQDFGGRVTDYVQRYVMMNRSHKKLAIDGVCNSACGLFMGFLPPQSVCVTDNAMVGLHEAYDVIADARTGKIVGQKPGIDLTGTVFELEHFPLPIMMWLMDTGGLTKEIKFVPPPLLHMMYQECPDELINPPKLPKGEKVE